MKKKYSVFLNITTEISKENLNEFIEKKPAHIEIMPDPTSDGYIAGADYKVIVMAQDSQEAWALGEKKVFEEHAHEFPVADKSRLDVGRNALCKTAHEKEYGLDKSDNMKGSIKMSTNNNTAKKFKPLKILAIILLTAGIVLFAVVLMGISAEKKQGVSRIERYGIVSVDDPEEGMLVFDDEDEFKEYVDDSWYLKELAILFFSPGVICMGIYLVANKLKKQ